MDPELAARVPRIGQRADYYRAHLLAAQGGMWLDIDAVVFHDLSFIFDALQEYELVARCRGGRINNSLLATHPNSPIMKDCIRKQEQLLTAFEPGDRLHWMALGADILTESVDDTGKCMFLPYDQVAPIPWKEADRLTSPYVRPDRVLALDPVMVMLYNSKFPQWLQTATEREVLESPIMLARLLRIALGESTLVNERRIVDSVGRFLEKAVTVAALASQRTARTSLSLDAPNRFVEGGSSSNGNAP